MYKRPKISVIIPVYNVAAYLSACLESVCQQTFKDVEVIVVNDGSTDESGEIIARFKSQNPNFLCIEQMNQGLSSARRVGLARAEGEFICFLDGDDFLSPVYLEQLLRALEINAADMAVGRTVRYFTADGSVRYEPDGVFKKAVLTGAGRAVLLGQFSEAMSLCGKLIRLETARQLSFPQHITGDDILPAVQSIFCAPKIALAFQSVYFYRVDRATSLSHVLNGKFKNLWDGFGAAVGFVRVQKDAAAFILGMESVRWRCLLSHISAWGLTSQEWTLLKENKKEILDTPARVLKGFSWKTRAQFITLKAGLKYGFSYPALLKHAQKFAYHPLKQLLEKTLCFGRFQKNR